MISRYRRDAETIEELGLGWLKPMHENIPELAQIASSAGGPEHELSENCRKTDAELKWPTRGDLH